MSRQRVYLLDTNVWLDYYLGFRKGHESSRRLVEAVTESNDTLAFCMTTLKDVYYIVASTFKGIARQESGGVLGEGAAAAAVSTAWACVDNMQTIGCAVPLDLGDAWMAGKQRPVHADFEDDLVIAAAMRTGADCLVTNDEKLLRHCPVAALDVKDALALIESNGGPAA